MYQLDVVYDRRLYVRPADNSKEAANLMLEGTCACGRQWALKWYTVPGTDSVSECPACYSKGYRKQRGNGETPAPRSGKRKNNVLRNFMVCRPKTKKELNEHTSKGLRLDCRQTLFPMFDPSTYMMHVCTPRA